MAQAKIKCFITGAPRSGTTMLQLMLSKELIPEASIITAIVELFERNITYPEPKRFAAFLHDEKRTISSFNTLINQLVDNVAEKFNDNNPVLKCPEMAKYLESFSKLQPRVPVLFIVRDPRDIYASLKRVRKKQGLSTKPRVMINLIKPYYKNFDSKGVTIVRYEDICNSELIALNEFCIKHGLTIHELDRSDNFDKEDPFYSEVYGKSVTDKKIGNFISSLSPIEIFIIEVAFANVMQKYGYITSNNLKLLSFFSRVVKVLLVAPSPLLNSQLCKLQKSTQKGQV